MFVGLGLILLPQPLEGWDDRHMPLAFLFLSFLNENLRPLIQMYLLLGYFLTQAFNHGVLSESFLSCFSQFSQFAFLPSLEYILISFVVSFLVSCVMLCTLFNFCIFETFSRYLSQWLSVSLRYGPSTFLVRFLSFKVFKTHFTT